MDVIGLDYKQYRKRERIAIAKENLLGQDAVLFRLDSPVADKLNKELGKTSKKLQDRLAKEWAELSDELFAK